MNPGPVTDRLTHGVRLHGGAVDIRWDDPRAVSGAVRVTATAYDHDLCYVVEAGRLTADIDRVDPQLIYAAVADLPGACRIEIWHGQRRNRGPLRYNRGRDAGRCLALAGAMPGSRVSVRIRFPDSENAFVFNDRVLETLRIAFIASVPNVIPFPGARSPKEPL